MNFKALGEQLGLEEDEYRELIDLFIASGGSDYQNLLAAVTAGDVDQVRNSAHTIKGASGNLGLIEVSETAAAIETSAMNDQLDDIGHALETLKTQFDAIVAFVQK